MTTILPFAIQNSSEFSGDLYQRIQQQLLSFAQTYPVVGNLLIATEDGFEVAAILKEGDQDNIHKVAAMTSSLMGIGSAMLNEIGAGKPKLLTLEGDSENIFLCQIAAPSLTLCLTAIVAAKEPLGQIFWLLRQLSSAIEAQCSAMPEAVSHEGEQYE